MHEVDEEHHSPSAVVSGDADAWERSAIETATRLIEDVSTLETMMDGPLGDRSYRLLWTQLRDVQDRVRTASALPDEAKRNIEPRLRQISDRLRVEQKAARRQAAAMRAELRNALQLIEEGVREISSVAEAHDRRADLAVLRSRIEGAASGLDKNTRQQLWQEWQHVNQAAWDSLVRNWQINEEKLRALLSAAEEHTRAGDIRPAREAIKAFHAMIAEQEASHRGARELRQIAGRLWRETDEVAKKKHAAYLQHAGRRVQQWRGRLSRTAQLRAGIAAEVEQLTIRAKSAPTDVGAALLRGQLAEREKALSEMDAEIRRLQGQIEATEAALARE